MSEWVNAVIGGAIGFTFGAILEPVKLHFRSWYEIRQLRSLLLEETARNYEKLDEYIDFCETEPPFHVERRILAFDTICYDHAITQTMLFQQIEHSNCIDGAYRALVYAQVEDVAKDRLWKARSARKEFAKLQNCPFSKEFQQLLPTRLRAAIKHVAPPPRK
jgi:hypothetical protein